MRRAGFSHALGTKMVFKPSRPTIETVGYFRFSLRERAEPPGPPPHLLIVLKNVWFDPANDPALVRITTYADSSTRVETFGTDGLLLSLCGTAVQPRIYLRGADSGGAFTVEVKPDVNGGTNEWVKTSTDAAGRAYKTVYPATSGNPFAISYYNSLGQLTNQVDPDGVSTIYAYAPLGERAYTVLDSNRNYSIDFAGTDRITFVTNDVTTDNGFYVRRTRTYAWTTDADSSTPTSTTETSVDGLHTWNLLWNGHRGTHEPDGHRLRSGAWLPLRYKHRPRRNMDPADVPIWTSDRSSNRLPVDRNP
jgi:hypothetical protein